MNVPPNVMVWLQLVGLLAAEVALIAGSGALLQRFIRSAWGRRTLWQVCLLSMLVLPFCELTGVARALAGRLVGRAEPRATATQTASDVPPDLSAEFRKEVAGRVALNAEQAGADPAKGQSDIPSGRAGLPLSTVGLPSAHRRQRPLNPAAGTEDIVADSMTILYSGLVWLGGTAAVMGRSFLGAVLLLLLRQRQRAEVDAALQERIARLACQLGLKRRVRLVESARLGGPIVFGVFRPVIGLPRDFAHRFSPAQQEVVLAHELAHLAAWDPLWYGLANLARALLWWHPLVWWVRRQLHSASEQAADEASLLVADGPGVLAECLVELGARLTQERSFVRLGVEGTGLRSGLGRRVERLVQLRESSWTRPGRRGSALAKTLGPAGLVSAVILCTAWVGPPAFNKGESMKTMSQTWSRSLAALALLTSLQEETHAASAANALRSDKPVAIAARVQDGQRLYEAGNLDATESILKEAASRAPDNGNVSYYLTLLQVRRYAQGEKDPNRTQTAPARIAEKPATPEPAPAPAASNPETKPVPEKPGATDDENYRRYNRLMMERYGLIPRGAPLNQNEGNPISARLEKIVLNEVMFDGVPLPEVLKLLDEESRKRDPEKHGINFLINPNGTPGGAIQTIDPQHRPADFTSADRAPRHEQRHHPIQSAVAQRALEGRAGCGGESG